MGRKPNPLILKHFDRGLKLNDSSNRYEHSCKSCGERFPKGRIDTLTSHLLNRCPALDKTARDQARQVLEAKSETNAQITGQRGELQMDGTIVNLPMHSSQQWNGLEALAEAARHSDFTEHHPAAEHGFGGLGSPEPPRMGDHGINNAQLFTLTNPPVSYDQRGLRGKKAITQKPNGRRNDQSTMRTDYNHVAQSRSNSPNNLFMAASSIAAAQAAAKFSPDMVDPQLLGDDVNKLQEGLEKTPEQHLAEQNASFQTMIAGLSEQQETWATNATGSAYVDQESSGDRDNIYGDHETQRSNGYTHIAVNPEVVPTQFREESGNGGKSIKKQKSRAHFNQDRRREVSEIRKIGACIRCRLLKKPCSGGQPCYECSKVDCARVWTMGCTRIRIYTHLDMYSSGLHSVLACSEVNRAKAQIEFQVSALGIEASHFSDTTIFVSVDALEGQQVHAGSNIDPDLSDDNHTTLVKLIGSNVDLVPKIEEYVQHMLPTFIQREVSAFMRTTLNTAQEVCTATSDPLLRRILEFWATVHVLVDHELQWKLSEGAEANAAPGQGTSIVPDSNDGTYPVICLQLNAAAEKRAAVLCKSILQQLDKRLLAPKFRPHFDLYIGSVILLSCFEKSAWLFKSWEQESFSARWPLAQAPDEYIRNAETVISLMQILLNNRKVTPTITQREDGILVSSHSEHARIYFERLNLTYSEVSAKQVAPVFDQTDSRCYELRYCSQLLLPQT